MTLGFFTERLPLFFLPPVAYFLAIRRPVLTLALFFVIARKLGLGLTSIQFFILVVGLPVTVMASYVFYLVFERPFVNARPASAPGTPSRPCRASATGWVSRKRASIENS